MTRAKKKRRKKAGVRIRLPKRTEVSIETAACERIEEIYPEALIRKLNGGGNRNWPDRMVLLPSGIAFFIEFKRPGEELRPGQMWIKEQLGKRGFNVFVGSDVDMLMDHLDVYYPVQGLR